METFKTPKLLITDHYESLIRQVDIFTEELLEIENRPNKKYKKSDENNDEYDYCFDDYGYDVPVRNNVTNTGKIDEFNDPYSEKYDYQMSETKLPDAESGTKQDYLELVRSKAIEKLKQAEKETLDRYEENKDLYKYNRDELTDEKVDEMRRDLFKDKFCFVLRINEMNRLNSTIPYYTFITDFYLNDRQLKSIKDLYYNNNDKDSYRCLNEEFLFLHLINTYIAGLVEVEMQKYGTEIISINKSTLFMINRVKIDNRAYNVVNVDLQLNKSSIDMSFLKSLSLASQFYEWYREENEEPFYIRDLSACKNLEILRLTNMILNEDAFTGLHNLIKLELNRCKLVEYENYYPRVRFDDLTSLQVLRLERLDFPVDLKCLENLRNVKMYNTEIKYLRSLNENVNILEMCKVSTHHFYITSLNELGACFSRFVFSNLTHLYLTDTTIPCIKEEWFQGMKLLKELKLCHVDLENLDFCQYECFSQLEKLVIYSNQVKVIKEDAFSKLKQLKRLDLIHNPVSIIEPNAFRDLNNLEFLSMNLLYKLDRIERDTFNGLGNLKELSLNNCELKSIDSEAFNHTGNLVKLDLGNNKLKLKENIFAKLKYLKTIRLAQSDMKHMNKRVLESLKKSNIEILN